MFTRFATAFFLISSLVMGTAPARSQAPQEKIDAESINKIKEEGMSRSQVMELLSYLTDVYGPRLTGSPTTKAAQEWAKQKLSEWGLENSHLEPWDRPFGRGWSLEGMAVNMIKPQFSPMIAYPKAWSPSTKGAVRGPVLFFDAKNEADMEKYKGKLAGAIVMLSPARKVEAHFKAEGSRMTDDQLLGLANYDPSVPGQPRSRQSPEQRAAMELQNKKWQMIYAENPGVVLEPGRGDGGTIFVQSAQLVFPPDTPTEKRKNVRDKDAPPIVPQVVIASEHYNRIIRMIEKHVPVELEVNVSARFHDQDLMSYNVIAEIPGTDLRDELVMLGAHFDSWHSGTGATDNAAGSAVCLEAVRIIKALGLKPRRTIRIGLWTGEEQGLLGSRAYVGEHFGKRIGGPQPGSGPPQPPAEGQQRQAQADTNVRFELKPAHDKFAAYFNLDNGTGKVLGVYLQGNEAVRPIFRAWLAPFRDLGAATLSISNTGGTDHLSFDAVGLPGFQFIQDEIEYDTRTHHSNMDVYDRIQEDDMRQAATIMAAFVYNASVRDQKLPRKPLPGRTNGQAGQ